MTPKIYYYPDSQLSEARKAAEGWAARYECRTIKTGSGESICFDLYDRDDINYLRLIVDEHEYMNADPMERVIQLNRYMVVTYPEDAHFTVDAIDYKQARKLAQLMCWRRNIQWNKVVKLR